MVTGIQDYFHYVSGHGQIGRLIMEMANDGVVVRYCDNKLHVGGALSAIDKHIQAINDNRHEISLFLGLMEQHMSTGRPVQYDTDCRQCQLGQTTGSGK